MDKTSSNNNNKTQFRECIILWSTQSGRAKACARRTARILREEKGMEIHNNNTFGCSFDEYGAHNIISSLSGLVIMFVSTTGNAEHCDSIHETWKLL